MTKFSTAISTNCTACGGAYRMDLRGLGPKTDVICPHCQQTRRLTGKELRDARGKWTRAATKGAKLGAWPQADVDAALKVPVQPVATILDA